MNFISDKIIFTSLRNIEFGCIEIINYDGKKIILGNVNSHLKNKLKIKKPGFTLDIINKGSVGLAESYMRGDFETDNLTNLIEITARNIKSVHKVAGLLDIPLINCIKNIFLKNTKKRSKQNISKHYDLGNEFFSLWLDKTLTYSSAIFETEKKDLEEAQINKYKKLSSLVKPQQGDKMLEIGCGWGGFAEYIGKNYDVKLDCITISKKQLLFTKERIRRLGLTDKVNVQMLDCREVKKKYDCIISIEMIEAVGEKYLNNYFKTIKENLLPGGRGGIQAIIIKDELYDRYRTKEDFIQKYIFPGGFLPSLKSLNKFSNQSGLKIDSYQLYGNHYSSTLKQWRESFLKSWDSISHQGFDNSFKKMWDFYFSYCEAGFKSKNIDLVQFSLCNK